MMTAITLAEWVYEACRHEARLSDCPIVPGDWWERGGAFRAQFVGTIAKYLDMPKLPTPQEAHESWVKAYDAMGWRYGSVWNAKAKTHPDMVPFDELPRSERDKDAVFLAIVEAARKIREIRSTSDAGKD